MNQSTRQRSQIQRLLCGAALVIGCLIGSKTSADALEKHFINPASGYTQVVAVESNGTTTLYVSGQVSTGDTVEVQLRGVFDALRLQVKAGGGELTDIVRINTYIVNYQPEQLAVFKRVRDEFFPAENRPASTLVGVTGLALPEYRVEIDAIAVFESK